MTSRLSRKAPSRADLKPKPVEFRHLIWAGEQGLHLPLGHPLMSRLMGLGWAEAHYEGPGAFPTWRATEKGVEAFKNGRKP